MKIDRDDHGRWTPEFRAWLRAYLSGTATSEDLDRLDRAAQEAGERAREASRSGDALLTVTLDAESELDMLAALMPSARATLSPSLVAELLADELEDAIA